MRYFQQWAPSLPPREVRLKVLGCADLFPFQRYSALLGGEIMTGRAVRQEQPRQEAIIRRPIPVSPSMVWADQPSSTNSSTTSSDSSVWSWTTQDAGLYDSSPIPNPGRAGPEASKFPDPTHNLRGNDPVWSILLEPTCEITSVQTALNRIREIRFFEDIGPTVADVEDWMRSLGSAGDSIHPEYQHFLSKCETYPQMIWGPVSIFRSLLRFAPHLTW